MSNAQRLLLLGGAVVVLAVALIVLSGGSDNANNGATTTATAPVATAPAPGATTTITATTPAPAAQFTTIVVKGGKPVGGVKTITVRKGDQVRIEVTSPDTTSEIHLHGYDVKRELKAGDSVRFSFVANAEGIFEMELEQTAVQIAKIVVEP
jgi:FtsP/CotA-like multicopper oxidase with cupredoxin domain